MSVSEMITLVIKDYMHLNLFNCFSGKKLQVITYDLDSDAT